LRKRSRILFVVGVGSLGAGGALLTALAACSAAATNSPSFGVLEDSGATDGSLPSLGSDGGTPGTSDSGTLGDGGTVPLVPPDAGPTSFLAVHASANLYDFRLCFGVDDAGVLPVPAYPDDPSHPMPETNYPGVPVGGAALLPAIQIGGGPLTLTAYVIPAYYLQSQGYVAGAEPTCDRLIADDLIPQAVEYFTLPPVTIASAGGTFALAIEGCGVGTGLAAGSTAQCGASYSSVTGNLTAFPAALTPSTDAGGWAMQLTQLSPSFDQGAGATVTYVDPTSDASVALTAYAANLGAPVTVALSEAGVTAAYFVLSPVSGAPVTESLATMQYFQAPSSDPFTYFSAPSTYLVAVVGDATDAAAPVSLPDGAANPAFDGHGLHVIAYPETGE
jgi:hypothetical protein